MNTVAQPTLPEALGDAARDFITKEHGLLIGAENVPAADGRTFATLDPATGREIATVAQAGAEDVARAVAAACEAFQSGPWSSLAPSARGALMMALADAIEAHEEEIAQIESLDNGKPVKLAQYVDVRGTIAHLRYFAGWPTKIEGSVLPVTAPDMLCYTRREASRRVRADRAVELPADDGRVEDRPGAGGGLHDRAQACRADTAERATSR